MLRVLAATTVLFWMSACGSGVLITNETENEQLGVAQGSHGSQQQPQQPPSSGGDIEGSGSAGGGELGSVSTGTGGSGGSTENVGAGGGSGGSTENVGAGGGSGGSTENLGSGGGTGTGGSGGSTETLDAGAAGGGGGTWVPTLDAGFVPDAGGPTVLDAGLPVPDAGVHSPCQPGFVQTWRFVADTFVSGGAAVGRGSGQRIVTGPGGAPMTHSCEPSVNSTCGGSDVQVVSTTTSGYLQATVSWCAPTPTTCPAGKYPAYLPPAGLFGSTGTVGSWICSDGCDLLISYGQLYGDRVVCAPTPTQCTDASAPVPLFQVDTETWTCAPYCNGSTYDPTTYNGFAACVPC